jgi:hypothetical protein
MKTGKSRKRDTAQKAISHPVKKDPAKTELF